ncbi:MAG: alanine racemase [Chitinophagia bacterium]|nr:alanine racemase [Chitinophagia bacterium]
MTRPTCLYIKEDALLNNLEVIKKCAPNSKIIAMVKANAYGCGVRKVVPILKPNIFAFGVACIEEALEIRDIDATANCILFEGVFSKQELDLAYLHNMQIVIHQQRQLDWLLECPSNEKIRVWVKFNTGMHRLGFLEEEVSDIMQKLYDCPWVDKPIGMMSHFASADDVDNINNIKQVDRFLRITNNYDAIMLSMANSAAILALPNSHFDVVRPGLMLYGVSPLTDKSADELGLEPVMRFVSEVTEIHNYDAFSAIGYSGTWYSDKPSRIGVVPVGYADGYPRLINTAAKVWVAGNIVPIVGRISMDMLTIDLTTCKNVQIGEEVELWGQYISVNDVANTAGTIGHEVIARIGDRVIRK